MTTNEEEKLSNGKISKASNSYTRSKDPRIVCVSRAFGGKDRHSKVCTVRGLRDRRVRLSVPTAIQLYDLQDRLGLNQPSKVVDWLLDAAKNEIDELPPLRMPQGNFGQSSNNINAPQFDKEGLKIDNSINWDDQMHVPRPNYWNLDANKSKEVERNDQVGKGSDHLEGNVAYNIFSRNNQPNSLPAGLINSAILPNSSFLRWDPSSNLSLSNFGAETENHHGFNVAPLMPYFPSGSEDFDPNKQFNFQMLGSSSSQHPQLSINSVTPPIYNISQGMRPFDLSINPNLFPCHNDSSGEPNKDN
ncbi:hypothetical protein LguiB_009020 [Lonicera macranthoides]